MSFLHTLQCMIEQLRDEWDLLLWRSSDEYREMVTERLALHKQAMLDGTKSPYFDQPEWWNWYTQDA